MNIVDAGGNRTTEQNRVPTTPVRNFQSTTNTGTWGGVYKTYIYDALNRLTKEYEHDTAQSIYYSYDALGNRVTQKDNRDSLTYTYNELNQLVEKKAYNGFTTYVYDKRGNRIKESSQYTQENRRTYEWDETNRLVKGTRGPDYGLYESTYTYNALGLRVNSTIMGPDKTKYDRDYVIDYTSPERNDIAEYNIGHTQWNGSKKVHDLSYLYNQDGERLEVNVNRYNSWSTEVVKYSLNIHEDIKLSIDSSEVRYAIPDRTVVIMQTSMNIISGDIIQRLQRITTIQSTEQRNRIIRDIRMTEV